MSESRSKVLEENKKKGVQAGAAAAATVAIAIAGAPVVAAIAAVPAAVLGWRWWRHRAENGIRF
jgi:ribonuclease PH